MPKEKRQIIIKIDDIDDLYQVTDSLDLLLEQSWNITSTMAILIR